MLAWIVLLPLLGFLLNGLWYIGRQVPAGKKAGAVPTGALASLAVGGSFLLGLTAFLKLQSLPPESRVLEQVLSPGSRWGTSPWISPFGWTR